MKVIFLFFYRWEVRVYFFKIFIEILKLRNFKFIVFIISIFFMLNIEDFFYRQNGLFYFLLIILSVQKNNYIIKKNIIFAN